MSVHSHAANVTPGVDLLAKLNGAWHRRAVNVFMAIVAAHWVEHLVQAAQVWALGWTREDAKGALGLLWPALVSSEALHYFYAIVMLIGLIVLRPGFSGTARTLWTVALILQVWHHMEHLLLLIQVLAGDPWFAAAKPTSLIQLLVPRIELHMFYNAVVFTPMAAAVYLQATQSWKTTGTQQEVHE